MAVLTIIVGILLMILGLGGYAWVNFTSWTALLPSIFGVVMAILGALALKPRLRKHAMHAAAALGLIGFIGSAARAIPKLFQPLGSGQDNHYSLEVFTCLAVMAVLCAVFVGLCVKSFIDARRRRAQQLEA